MFTRFAIVVSFLVAELIDPSRSRTSRISRKQAWIVMFLCVAVGALSSATRFAASAPPEIAPASDEQQPTAKPSVAVAGTETGTSILRGKVLGPGDRPIAGARLYLNINEWSDPIELGTSDVSGSYRFALPEKTLRRTVTAGFPYGECQASLIATDEGLGSSWAELVGEKGGRYGQMKPEYVHDFRLAADFPIAGRVIDAGGKPVAGATVAVQSIYDLADPRWWKMHAAIKAADPNLMSREQTDPNNWFTPLYPTAWKAIPSVTTDVEGRFQLRGVGGDRAIKLGVSGPGIRSMFVSVLTRDDVGDFTQKIRAKYPRTRHEPDGYFYPERKEQAEGDAGALLFGSSPTIEVSPARTISGIVRDASTGEPIAGMQMTTADAFGVGRATTDRHGRYRILRAEDDTSIFVYSDAYHADPYLTVVRRLADAKGVGEIVADFDVPRGVAVDGRVVDAGTDRPIVSAPRQGCHDSVPGPLVAGYVTYFPLATNAALRGTPTGVYFEGFPTGSQNYFKTAVIDGDGRFRIAVPSGPGVLLVQARPGFSMFGEMSVHKESEGLHRLFPYTTLASRSKDDGAPGGDPQSFAGFLGKIPLFPLSTYHAYRVINPPTDATSLDLKFTVHRGLTRLVRFVDPEGRPITGVNVRGLTAMHPMMPVVLDGSEAELLNVEPGKPRQVIAVSGDDKYVTRTFVSSDDLQPKTIGLEPAGSVIGRIVDENGKPMKGLLSSPNIVRTDIDPGLGVVPQVHPDAEGRFRFAPLFPGLHYSAVIRGEAAENEVVGTICENVVVNTGEVRDLGEIRIKPDANRQSRAKPGS